MLHAQRQGLTGECSADVSGHVVVALVVVLVARALTQTIKRALAVLGHDRIHPGTEIVEDPGVGVLVDGEACAGVQTREVQHA